MATTNKKESKLNVYGKQQTLTGYIMWCFKKVTNVQEENYEKFSVEFVRKGGSEVICGFVKGIGFENAEMRFERTAKKRFMRF